ncbi:multidrug ABC transporter ATP-binding protein [Mangrovactinospora gilvigrisea]|uniref:Multidrug ABC transporter ATP-binding protein n=1 Tax=Mangrovactinospora gilvigrisea TaxID=1428644 RepID=A0A1J7CG85_9ACTN|nr:ABC transporter ATP-binding protein [Mangrovactinospora gilvigrisea]OIV38674.1 multidrug ABC transporter ATP-binding protein [Mangrovactinospora gilvigrisea]
MSSTDAVAALGLTRRYGRGATAFEALRGVSFRVARGELFALLGTNGAGKTSALELLEGLAAPSSGSVRVLGHDPYRERAAVRPRTGVVLQDGGLPGLLTPREAAEMWQGTLSRPRPAWEALELVGLADRRDVAIQQLSGGERRRLDLALALLGRPELLFLDEPTTGLDPESRRGAWDLVRGLLAGGATVVLTTHYLEEAEELADRLAILHRGAIVATGTPAEVAAGLPARVSFELPDGVEPPRPSGEDVRVAVAGADGRRVTITTPRLQSTLGEVLAWADGRGLELHGLDARSGSLEEAFLAVAADGASGANTVKAKTVKEAA